MQQKLITQYTDTNKNHLNISCDFFGSFKFSASCFKIIRKLSLQIGQEEKTSKLNRVLKPSAS
ncbi:hypothetical protein T4D_8709 [Trichinella pseudospiralis]|uniref:Uncharacterized protein n=1 Tax=Trichinella pseudospiralis TaxID=6337 RepID=A0A0V1G1X1_TRIPS|nr:hypothetical protein T4D_8709 [Trichinella pseudospiralis]